MTTHSNDDTIRGAKAIAHELGWSVSTLHRMRDKLPVYKSCTGGATSPLEVLRADLEAFKRSRRG